LKDEKEESKVKEINPLGILLKLLNDKKLEISNFSLAQVADQYLNYLKNFKNVDEILVNISDFIWVASKLALLKSKILLNSLELTSEELEESDELKIRLIEYKKFKEISEILKNKFEDQEEFIARKNRSFAIKDFSINFNKSDLAECFEKLIREFVIDDSISYQKKSIKEVIKIEEKIKEIQNILNQNKKIKFSRIISKKSSRLEVVISFLSILELVKQGFIQIRQEKSFEEIEISRRG